MPIHTVISNIITELPKTYDATSNKVLELVGENLSCYANTLIKTKQNHSCHNAYDIGNDAILCYNNSSIFIINNYSQIDIDSDDLINKSVIFECESSDRIVSCNAFMNFVQCLVQSDTAQQIFVSIDYGQTWSDGLVITDIYKTYINEYGKLYVFAMANGIAMSYVSTDYMQLSVMTMPNDIRVTDILTSNDITYASFDNGSIMRTNVNEDTWHTMGASGLSFIERLFTCRSALYAYSAGKLTMYLPAIDSWTTISYTNVLNARGIVSVPNRRMDILYGAGMISVSKDLGNTWSEAKSIGISNVIYAIAQQSSTGFMIRSMSNANLQVWQVTGENFITLPIIEQGRSYYKLDISDFVGNLTIASVDEIKHMTVYSDEIPAFIYSNWIDRMQLSHMSRAFLDNAPDELKIMALFAKHLLSRIGVYGFLPILRKLSHAKDTELILEREWIRFTDITVDGVYITDSSDIQYLDLYDTSLHESYIMTGGIRINYTMTDSSIFTLNDMQRFVEFCLPISNYLVGPVYKISSKSDNLKLYNDSFKALLQQSLLELNASFDILHCQMITQNICRLTYFLSDEEAFLTIEDSTYTLRKGIHSIQIANFDNPEAKLCISYASGNQSILNITLPKLGLAKKPKITVASNAFEVSKLVHGQTYTFANTLPYVCDVIAYADYEMTVELERDANTLTMTWPTIAKCLHFYGNNISFKLDLETLSITSLSIIN